MIERYALSPIKDLWTLKNQYHRWLKVELAVVKAFEEEGIAPVGTADEIEKLAKIDVDNILDIESVVDHDVIAFIKSVTEPMGDCARYFHMGLTSSDVVDTGLAMAIVESTDHIIKALDKYMDALWDISVKYKNTLTIGRTHGIHGEPTSFGLKMLGYLAEAQRNYQRLLTSRDEIAQGKLSGAVGNYANISPQIEQKALKKLGLSPAKVSTQVVARDVHAQLINDFALLGTSIERIATEIRHLQKTEVLEAQEPFKKGQRGSSAMPHKKNPILCERLTGMARMLRSYTIPCYENMVLWHERDISHSSTERMIFPDSTMLIYYMITKATYLVENLVVNEDRMMESFNRSYGLVYSQRVLLKLIDKGCSRETTYKLIQKIAMESWDERRDFKTLLMDNKEVMTYLDIDELEELFDGTYYLRNIEQVYQRFENRR